MLNRLLPLSLVCAFAGLSLVTVAQRPNNFAPPQAFLHYSPDRTCDLLHVEADIDIDYPTRTFVGKAVNTLKPFRDGLTEIMLMAGSVLKISEVTVDEQPATYRRVENKLFVTVPATKKGRDLKIGISYSAKNTKAQPFGGRGGFHWIEPKPNDKTQTGFWTQGETESNSDWIPTWDYPNDLATSEIRATTQADWDIIGNGRLISTKLSADKKRKTWDWKMTQPHATYLLTLCGGPFDIKQDKWEGVDLWYVVPKGYGYMIDDSFGDTKDMLSFFSQRVGVKYPWPKYAQNAMFDFGGGMENVSATTLGEGSLTESRDGFRTMSSLNSHELGHQWFGDLVTCKDWGDAWLNESFATFMQFIYFEHSQGADAYAWEIDSAMREYFSEARRYKRPISTKLYTSGDNMFDSHTYPKGGAVLHTLRRKVGDDAFFGALKDYLTRWRHTPVESAQLRRAFTESTGIEAEPFWAQWFEKPGHPVLDYTWRYDGGKLLVTVKQLQDTKDGTPIYNIPTRVAAWTNDGWTMLPLTLTQAEETFSFPMASAPTAAILDPTHDFLREIPKLHWAPEELPIILKHSPNAPDRTEAMRLLLTNPTEANIALVVAALEADKGPVVALHSTGGWSNLYKPELRGFWTKMLSHPDFDRRTQAVAALAKLPVDPATTATLRSLINGKAPIAVVVLSIRALADWDAKGNVEVFQKATKIKDRRGRIAKAAALALDKSK